MIRIGQYPEDYAANGGRFTEGDAATQVPATRVRSYWLNAMQEELAAVVEAAAMELDAGDPTQVLQAIRAMIADALPGLSTLPVGSEIMWQSETLPDTSYGVWLEEDGSAFDAATYPELAAHLGGNVLPDARGNVARGYDHGRGVDAGRVLGSEQQDQMQGHGHIIKTNGGANATLSAFIATTNRAYTAWQSNLTSAGTLRAEDAMALSNGTPRVGGETRMRNISKIFLIKAK